MSRVSDVEGDVKSKLDVSHVEHSGADYSRNINAKIRNPLIGISSSDLRVQVTGFCREFGFEEKEDVFYRGALAAQNPENYESIDDLTEEDKHVLRREVTHKWHLPKDLYYSIALCSLGSAIQGWDNTGANGANLSFPQEFGIENNQALVGVINAGPTLFGLLSAWAADPINNYLGRRGTIFLTGLFCVFPVLAQAFTQNWWGLMICRLFMGLGMGIKISTIPIYSAEVAPAAIRGGIVTSFQLWVAFGIFVGFCSNLIWYRIGDLAWRFQLAAAFAPAIPVLIFVWMCPVIEENNAFGGQTLLRRMKELLTVPRLRRATVASSWIVISQQFSGINIMAFYSSTIFQQAGYSDKDCLLASMGFGLIMFVFAFPAVYMMDTFGRRNLLLATFPSMAFCLLAAGLSFLLNTGSSARVPLIAFFIYLFTAMYGPGIGPLPSIYFSEAFPLSHREIGSAFTICVNNAVGSALTLSFPELLHKIGPTGAFCFYAGLNLLAFFVIFFIIPETKQRTLEELDYIFGVPTSRHAAYQARTWLPWVVKRYLFFQKDAKLEPLYHSE
ncbi:putative polyol transporter 1 [Colletotrichum tropicale]|nr:putative polyol transporter 1 [Colletotrichum tropicale]